MELPTFGSATGYHTYRNKDGESKGSGSHLFSPLSRSRSSTQEEESEDKLRNCIQSSKRLSALSRGLSLGREESPDLIKRDEAETRSNSMKGLNDSEVLNNSGRFHFSTHKWASKGERAGKNESANSVKKSSVILDAVENIKKKEGRRNSFDIADVGKTSMQGSPRNSRNFGKSKVKGKVKEFFKMFNQDTSLKPRIDMLSKSQSCRWKENETVKAENKVNINMSETDEKVQMNCMKKEKSLPDVSVMVDDYLGKTAKRDSTRMIRRIAQQQGLIKEIIKEETKVQQSDIDREGMQVIDSKIRQWSNGKLGNIRSLLSTLQYVLWPDSGWKSVPLMDIIKGNAVKRSYQKALPFLHPDKLQQTAANLQQKYIAAKVFDILQDAWTFFNSLSSV